MRPLLLAVALAALAACDAFPDEPPFNNPFDAEADDTVRTPMAPAGLDVLSRGGAGIGLTWTDLSRMEQGYRVEVAEGLTGGDFQAVVDTEPNAEAAEVSLGRGAHVYRLRVRAIGPDGPTGLPSKTVAVYRNQGVAILTIAAQNYGVAFDATVGPGLGELTGVSPAGQVFSWSVYDGGAAFVGSGRGPVEAGRDVIGVRERIGSGGLGYLRPSGAYAFRGSDVSTFNPHGTRRAFAADGAVVVETVPLEGVASPQTVAALPAGPVADLAMSPDGETVYVLAGGALRALTVATGAETWRVAVPTADRFEVTWASGWIGVFGGDVLDGVLAPSGTWAVQDRLTGRPALGEVGGRPFAARAAGPAAVEVFDAPAGAFVGRSGTLSTYTGGTPSSGADVFVLPLTGGSVGVMRVDGARGGRGWVLGVSAEAVATVETWAFQTL